MASRPVAGAGCRMRLAQRHERRTHRSARSQRKADRKAFVDFAWTSIATIPTWVPPLKGEVHGLLDPEKNPWFGHAKAQLFLAERDGKIVGRISAHVDDLRCQDHMGPGAANGACSRPTATRRPRSSRRRRLASRAGHDPRARARSACRSGMNRACEIEGFDKPPTVMMGHHRPEYRRGSRPRATRRPRNSHLRARHHELARSR